jgi:Abnormal spindle-like microcephaly-assoc'd, ASPM-SPD-2-Hydin
MKSLEKNRVPAGTMICALPARFRGMQAIPVFALSLLLFVILSVSGCTGVTGGSKIAPGQQTSAGASTISLAPADINFSEVPVGGTGSQSVTITNSGGSPLTVTQVNTTAAGITVSGISLPLTIEPGSQSNFNLVFSPKKPAVLSANVSVVSNVSKSPSMVSLHGIGMAASAFLVTSTSSLDFGSVSTGKSKGLSVVLTNAGNTNVDVSKVAISGARYTVSGVSTGLILAPGQSATLDASFDPLAAGAILGRVTVSSNATNSPAIISLSGIGGLPSVLLDWVPSTSLVAGYRVYRSENSGGPYVKLSHGIVQADTYTDSTVQSGLTYYYVVTSVTPGDRESADSTQTSVTIP